MIDIKYLILLFFIYSLLGWIIEVVGKLIQKHRFINRGFLVGPICPIYGVGCIIMTVFLTKFSKSIFILFGMSIIICSTLEYLTSYIMEKLFKARWWDYSNRKFNLNGRICLETMIPFGVLGCIVIGVLNPIFISILSLLNKLTINGLIYGLSILFIIDISLSSNIMIKFRNTMKIVEKDGTEEITKKVKEILLNKNILLRRLINAFPDIKSNIERLKEVRTMINNRINSLKR